MRFLLSLAFSFVVAACAGPTGYGPTDYLRYAEGEIKSGQWEKAYRSLESVIGSNDPARAKRAQELLLQYPQLTAAAKQTFSAESIANTVAKYGLEVGINTERSRLDVYRAVAAREDYEVAQKNVSAAASSLDAKRRQQDQARAEAEEARKQARADAERARAEARAELAQAAEKSRYHCLNRDACQKAFSLTQIFITENSDMKIQVATDTIVETYNPTESMRVALKAVRIPGAGSSSTIVLSGSCKGENGRSDAIADFCVDKMLRIYRGYPSFMQASLID